MFTDLHAKLLKETFESKAATAYYIQHGYLSTWPENDRVQNDRALQRFSTAAKWEAYQAGRLSREKAVEIAIQRAGREADKECRDRAEMLRGFEAAPDCLHIAIRVEWKRSGVYGWNPHAVAIINHENRYEGKASGCGYDKRTTAIVNALNQSATARKMLCQAREAGKALQGAGYGAIPYFEGGRGMSALAALLQECGLTWHACDESGKHMDYYTFGRD